MNRTTGESAVSELRELPSVNEVLQTPRARQIRERSGDQRLTAIARNAVVLVRNEILAGGDNVKHSRGQLLDRIISMVEAAWSAEYGKRVQRVINATGVVIHTNLGRAPLSAAAVEALVHEASGYCTVEYDLGAGNRGRRGERAETLLCELTGAEDALIVNNCAAAAFMVLSVLAADKEVVISRGELVEIGGDFRVPDVLTQSGAVLREVGTTNRTKIADFENAVGERTAMLLRVHPSNYKITGFTEMPTLEAMAALAREKKICMYEDAGSGALIDMTKFGLADEPVISNSIRAGVDIVSFSGDKLLGGPQCGIIVGRRELIEQLRRSPLYRALRVSKLTYAALEATLAAYTTSTPEAELPVLRMLAITPEVLARRSAAFTEGVHAAVGEFLNVEVISGQSVVGGGAAPDFHPATSLVALRPVADSAAALERRLRIGETPVIARLQDDRVLIDLRTVSVDEVDGLLEAVAAASRP
ncbi:MAG: L-seryl-tRNA(Sec) selenium transferase [Acidobacteriota bacterium]